MQLSEDKTYRTRDGSRTRIRVYEHDYIWLASIRGSWNAQGKHSCGDARFDLIEETPAPAAFSYDACPTGPDGRKRAVTRDGREVVLLCADAPGRCPVAGFLVGPADSRINGIIARTSDGRASELGEDSSDLLIPPRPKRTVWVNLYEDKHCVSGKAAVHHHSQEEADRHADGTRLGNRAYPIEVDA